MKLLFLGTGAAGNAGKTDAELALKPGRRRCSSLLLDDTVLVDVALQSFDCATRLGKDTSAVTDLFISHTHGDHYIKATLFQYVAAAKQKINVWCHEGAVVDLGLSEEEVAQVNLCPVKVMDKWEAAGMTVTALPANHLAGGPAQQPLHFIFEKDGKTLFYGCDGGWFRADTWEYMRTKGVLFNGAIFDATVGDLPGNFRIGTHNTVPMLHLLLTAMRECGIITPKTTLIANHIGVPPYDSVKKGDYGRLTELGMVVTADEMELEI